MRFACFFRNVNFGRPGKPTQAQFVGAFEQAGAEDARSFLTHGNAIFSAPSQRAALTIMRQATATLKACCGLDEPAFVRSIKHLAQLVASDPFADSPSDAIHERCVSFVTHDAVASLDLPVVTARRDVEIFAAGPQEFFSVSRAIGASPGSPNALIERRLGIPATTRNWNTVVRIVALDR